MFVTPHHGAAAAAAVLLMLRQATTTLLTFAVQSCRRTKRQQTDAHDTGGRLMLQARD